MKLLGVGKTRFHTLSYAARTGSQFCPYDLRFTPKGKRSVQSEKREKVHAFLTQLYEQTAEFIPDGLNSNKRPRRGTSKFDRPDLNRDSIKHLPYGTINDYFKQCVAAHPGLGIGRKLFCSDACLGLADILKFKVCVCNTNQNIWQVSIVFVLFLYHFSLKLDLFRVPCNSTNPRFGKRTLRGNYAYGFSPTTPNAASVFIID